MKRLALAICLAPTLLLAACGGTACSSAPATPQSTSPNCTAAAGQPVTVNVLLCGKCTDSSPSCQAEFLSDSQGQRVEVQPTVEQCQEQASCGPGSSCDISSPTASCTVTIPSGTTGSVQLVLVGNTTSTGTLTIGQGMTCNL
jgi:hypothetical protein